MTGQCGREWPSLEPTLWTVETYEMPHFPKLEKNNICNYRRDMPPNGPSKSYIPSVPNVPESQMSQMTHVSHVSQMVYMSQISQMSQVFQMSHVSQMSRMSHVSKMPPCVLYVPNVKWCPKTIQIMMENISAIPNVIIMGGQSQFLTLITKYIDTTSISHREGRHL